MSVAQKIPLSPEQAAFCNSFPIRSTPCNFAGLDDNDYDITGPEREEVVADILKCLDGTLSKKVFADKWHHLKLPARNVVARTEKVMEDGKKMAKI